MRSLFETLQSTAGYTELGQETVMSEDHKEVFNMPSEAGLFLELSLDDYSVLGTGVQHEVVCRGGDAFLSVLGFNHEFQDEASVLSLADLFEYTKDCALQVDKEGAVRFIGSDGKSIADLSVGSQSFDTGWYFIRGFKTEDGDFRSVQAFRRIGKEEPLRLIGCVSIQFRKDLQKSRVNGIFDSLDGRRSASPQVRQAKSVIDKERWHVLKLTVDLKPWLVPGELLLAEAPDGGAIILGDIEYLYVSS